MMFIRLIALFLVISCMVLLQSPVSQAVDCSCGPDYCKNDPRYPPLLANKKAEMRKDGYPERLIALMDQDGDCVARVERSPDGFSLKRMMTNGNSFTEAWSPEVEDQAKAEKKSGVIKSFYIFNVAKAFQCCGDKKAEDRDDYDRNLTLNRKLALAFE